MASLVVLFFWEGFNAMVKKHKDESDDFPTLSSADPHNYDRQWAEVTAVKSFYAQEYEELPWPWKLNKHPPHFVLHLNNYTIEPFMQNDPTEAEPKQKLAVDVIFRMSVAYPAVIPEIKVVGKLGLTASQVSALQCQVQALAESERGHEVVIVVAEWIRNELMQDLQSTSIHAAMLNRKEEEEAQAEALELAKKASREATEEQMKSEMASRIAQELQKSASSQAKELLLDPPVTFIDPVTDSTVHLDHISLNKFGQDQEDIYTAQLPFKTTSYLLIKRVSYEEALQRAVEEAIEIPCHPNITATVGLQQDRSDRKLKSFVWILQLLPHPGFHEFSKIETKNWTMPKWVEVLKQLLQACTHLHSNGLRHGSIGASSILVSEQFEGTEVLLQEPLYHHYLLIDDRGAKTASDMAAVDKWLRQEATFMGNVEKDSSLHTMLERLPQLSPTEALKLLSANGTPWLKPQVTDLHSFLSNTHVSFALEDGRFENDDENCSNHATSPTLSKCTGWGRAVSGKFSSAETNSTTASTPSKRFFCQSKQPTPKATCSAKSCAKSPPCPGCTMNASSGITRLGLRKAVSNKNNDAAPAPCLPSEASAVLALQVVMRTTWSHFAAMTIARN